MRDHPPGARTLMYSARTMINTLRGREIDFDGDEDNKWLTAAGRDLCAEIVAPDVHFGPLAPLGSHRGVKGRSAVPEHRVLLPAPGSNLGLAPKFGVGIDTAAAVRAKRMRHVRPLETKQRDAELVSKFDGTVARIVGKESEARHVCSAACDLRTRIMKDLCWFMSADPAGIVWSYCLPVDFMYDACVADDAGWFKCACGAFRLGIPSRNQEELAGWCCKFGSVKILTGSWMYAANSFIHENDKVPVFNWTCSIDNFRDACAGGHNEIVHILLGYTDLWRNASAFDRLEILGHIYLTGDVVARRQLYSHRRPLSFSEEVRAVNQISHSIPEVNQLGGGIFSAVCWNGHQEMAEYMFSMFEITPEEYGVALQCAAIMNRPALVVGLLRLPVMHSRHKQSTAYRAVQRRLASRLIELSVEHADGKVLWELRSHGQEYLWVPFDTHDGESAIACTRPPAAMDVRDAIAAFSQVMARSPLNAHLPAGLRHLVEMLTPFRDAKALSSALRELHRPGTKFTTNPHDGLLARAFKALAARKKH